MAVVVDVVYATAHGTYAIRPNKWRKTNAAKIISDMEKTMSDVEKITSDIIQTTSDLFSPFAKPCKTITCGKFANGRKIMKTNALEKSPYPLWKIGARGRNLQPKQSPQLRRKCRNCGLSCCGGWDFAPCAPSVVLRKSYASFAGAITFHTNAAGAKVSVSPAKYFFVSFVLMEGINMVLMSLFRHRLSCGHIVLTRKSSVLRQP